MDEKEGRLPSSVLSIIQKSEKLLAMTKENETPKVKKKKKKRKNFDQTENAVDSMFPNNSSNGSINEIVTSSSTKLPPINNSKNKSGKKDLSKEWFDKHVNTSDKSLDALTHLDWENEIAKHIVSMFATTKIGAEGQRLDTGKSILSYVEPTPGVLSAQSIRPDTTTKVNVNSRPDSSASSNDSKNISRITSRPDSTLNTIKENKQLKSPKNKDKNTDPLNRSHSDINHNLMSSHSITRPKSENNITTDDTFMNNNLNETKKSSKFRDVVMVKRKDGKEVALRGRVSVSPIWFISTGGIVTDFTSLINGNLIQKQLDSLYERELYIEYVSLASKVIEDQWIKHKYHNEITNLKPVTNQSSKKVNFSNENLVGANVDYCFLWEQVILAGNAMTILSIEKKNYETALELCNSLVKLTFNDNILVDRNNRYKLRGYVNDTFSYYFYRRQLTASSLIYSQKALDLHEKCNNIESIAQTILQIANVEIVTKKYYDAHKTIYRFLAMVEDGRLARLDATPKQLCLVAIAYHNLAVIQLHLEVPDLACKSSMNARKIARLCLSHSNRWLPNFQWTHEAAVEDVKYLLNTRTNLTTQQLNLLNGLVNELYTQHSPVKP